MANDITNRAKPHAAPRKNAFVDLCDGKDKTVSTISFVSDDGKTVKFENAEIVCGDLMDVINNVEIDNNDVGAYLSNGWTVGNIISNTKPPVKDIHMSMTGESGGVKHNKQWSAFVFEPEQNNTGTGKWKVKTVWGAIGSSLQSAEKEYDTKDAAEDVFGKLYASKKSKGYKAGLNQDQINSAYAAASTSAPTPTPSASDASSVGKPCGDSFISADKTCHVGESQPVKPQLPSPAEGGMYGTTQKALHDLAKQGKWDELKAKHIALSSKANKEYAAELLKHAPKDAAPSVQPEPQITAPEAKPEIPLPSIDANGVKHKVYAAAKAGLWNVVANYQLGWSTQTMEYAKEVMKHAPPGFVHDSEKGNTNPIHQLTKPSYAGESQSKAKNELYYAAVAGNNALVAEKTMKAEGNTAIQDYGVSLLSEMKKYGIGDPNFKIPEALGGEPGNKTETPIAKPETPNYLKPQSDEPKPKKLMDFLPKPESLDPKWYSIPNQPKKNLQPTMYKEALDGNWDAVAGHKMKSPENNSYQAKLLEAKARWEAYKVSNPEAKDPVKPTPIILNEPSIVAVSSEHPSGVDTSNWPANKHYAVWGAKKISAMEKLFKEGKFAELAAVDIVPSVKSPQKWHFLVEQAYNKLISQIPEQQAAQLGISKKPVSIQASVQKAVAAALKTQPVPQGSPDQTQKLNEAIKSAQGIVSDILKLNAGLEYGKDVVDTTKWTNTGGPLGSNPGGTYTDEKGQKWYVKQSKSNEHAMNEVLTAKLYEAAGASVLPYKIAYIGSGKFGTATPWMEKIGVPDSSNPTDVKAAHADFATHAWLANWDCLGASADNLAWMKVGDQVKMTELDTGGGLKYRAQGGEKGDKFNAAVNEWDSLRNPDIAKVAGKFFKSMTAEELVESTKKVAQVSPQTIDALVDKYTTSGTNKAALRQLIKQRRNTVLQKGGITDNALNDTSQATPVVTAPKPEQEAKKDSVDTVETVPFKISQTVKVGDKIKHEDGGVYEIVSLTHLISTKNSPQITIKKTSHGIPTAYPKGFLNGTGWIGKVDDNGNVIAPPVTTQTKAEEATPGDVAAPAKPFIPPPMKVPQSNAHMQKKFDAIYAAAQAGDIEKLKAIPVSSTSKGTYTKKQYAYKMSCLMALGAGEEAGKQSGGQLATPIITDLGGTSQQSKGAKKLTPEQLPALTDWGGPFVSKNQANVAQNKANMEQLNKWALAGDLDAIKNTPTFPSPKLEAYKSILIDKMTPPPPPPKKFEGKVADLHNLAPIVKVQEATKKFEYLLVVGNPGVINHGYGDGVYMLQNGSDSAKGIYAEWVAKNDAAHEKLTGAQKSAMGHYKGTTDGINDVLGKGQMTPTAKAAGQAIMKAGQYIPEGTNILRKFSLGPKSFKEFSEAVGYAIQQPSVLGGSFRKDWFSSWHGNIENTLIVGPNVKGLYLGNFHGCKSEREILLPPNTRFVLQEAKMVGNVLKCKSFILPTVENQVEL